MEDNKKVDFNASVDWFKEFYGRQAKLQDDMVQKGLYDSYVDYVTKNNVRLPFDHPGVASYHIQQLISEIGEVLDADKRWKNMRNGKYDRDAKLEEVADCLIVAFNVALFSGFTAEELERAIFEKQDVVRQRVIDEKGGS